MANKAKSWADIGDEDDQGIAPPEPKPNPWQKLAPPPQQPPQSVANAGGAGGGGAELDIADAAASAQASAAPNRGRGRGGRGGSRGGAALGGGAASIGNDAGAGGSAPSSRGAFGGAGSGRGRGRAVDFEERDPRDRSGRGGGRGGRGGGGSGRGGGRERDAPRRNESEDPTRREGWVSAIKAESSFGFIAPVDSADTIFFHFTDALTKGLAVDDEVEFYVVMDHTRGRAHAVRVTKLAPGTVTSEEVFPERVRGVVERELQGMNAHLQSLRGGRGGARFSRDSNYREPYGGLVRVAAGAESAAATATAGAAGAAAETVLYQFCLRDVKQGAEVVLNAGDVVECNVFREKKTGKKGVTAITLIAPNPAGRERGIVITTVKDSFGFIKRVTAPTATAADATGSGGGSGGDGDSSSEDVWFHFSQRVDQKWTPQKDDCVEYKVVAESGGKKHAERIVLLPKGSVKLETISVERYIGTVSKALALKPGAAPAAAARDRDRDAKSHAHPRLQFLPGTITAVSQLSVGADGKAVELALAQPEAVSFASNDVRWKRGAEAKHSHLLVGDVVEFNVAVRGQQRRAVNVDLVREGTAGRMQGIISVVKPDSHFGFVDCVDHFGDNRLFIHSSALTHATHTPDPQQPQQPQPRAAFAEGTEIEFAIGLDSMSGKPQAVRVRVLPKGSVVFEETLPTVYRGTVVKPAKKQRSERERHGKDHPPSAKATRGVIKAGGMPPSPFADEKAAATDPAGSDAELEFDESDIVGGGSGSGSGGTRGAVRLLEGDGVTFQLRLNRLTRRRWASAIKLIRISAENRETGVIASLEANGVGFIRRVAALDLVFFRTTSLLPAPAVDASGAAVESQSLSPPQLSVGDCVSFNISADGKARESSATAAGAAASTATAAAAAGKKGAASGAAGSVAVALRLQLLPKNSIVIETIDSALRYRGVVRAIPSKSVVRKPADRNARKPLKIEPYAQLPGSIELIQAAASAPASSPSPVPSPSPPPAADAKQSLAAAAVSPVQTELQQQPAPLVVQTFPFELADRGSLRVGDIVSFAVAVRSGAASGTAQVRRATAVQFLPKPAVVIGVSGAGGSIRTFADAELKVKEEVLTFAARDVSRQNDVASGPLRIGDEVVFDVVERTPKTERRTARSIRRTKAAAATADGGAGAAAAAAAESDKKGGVADGAAAGGTASSSPSKTAGRGGSSSGATNGGGGGAGVGGSADRSGGARYAVGPPKEAGVKGFGRGKAMRAPTPTGPVAQSNPFAALADAEP